MEQSPRNLSAYETATKPTSISKKLTVRSALPGIRSPFSHSQNATAPAGASKFTTL